MKFLRFLFIFALIGVANRHVLAGEFDDTTDGRYEETEGGFTKEQFEEMKNSPDPQVRQFYKNLINGRFSTKKAEEERSGNSRFSGHLEIHDFDLDGITDHDGAYNDVEGATEKGALGNGSHLSGEARETALDKARKSKGPGACLENVTGKTRPCRNISGALLDLGSAHAGGDDDDDHRVYDLTKETKAALEKAGQNYFASFKTQVLGGDKKDRIYGNDAIRSEAVWLYKQWQFKVEASWKTLRAARLAGFRTDDPSDRDIFASGSYKQGLEFMRRIGAMLGQSGSNENIAREIYLRGEVMDIDFCLNPGTNRWGVCPANPPPVAAGTPPPQVALRYLLHDSVPEDVVSRATAPRLSPADKNQLYSVALNAASAQISKDKNAQSKIAAIAKCLPAEVWCTTPINEARDEAEARRSARPGTPPRRTLEAYTPTTGDIGGVYWDTREPIFIKMSEASKLPLARQRAYVDGNQDFSKKMSGGRDNPIYQSWVDYITKTEKAVDEIHDMGKQQRLAAEAAGERGDDTIERTFDKNKKTVLEMFGNNAVNNTYSAGYGYGGAPAPASAPPSKQTLPGIDIQK